MLKRYITLLQDLVATPSFSREEDRTANIIEAFLHKEHIPTERKGNNIWAKNKHFTEGGATVLLNSHHDTVKPVQGWTRNPFGADIENGRLYGLGEIGRAHV